MASKNTQLEIANYKKAEGWGVNQKNDQESNVFFDIKRREILTTAPAR